MWRVAPVRFSAQDTLQLSCALKQEPCLPVAASEGAVTGTVMIDTTHLKAHRTVASFLKRGSFALDRVYSRQAQLQAARSLRRQGQTREAVVDRGLGQRLSRC